MNTLHRDAFFVLEGIRFTIGKNYRKVSFESTADSLRLLFHVDAPTDVDFIFFNEAIEDIQDMVGQESSRLVSFDVVAPSRTTVAPPGSNTVYLKHDAIIRVSTEETAPLGISRSNTSSRQAQARMRAGAVRSRSAIFPSTAGERSC